MAVMSSSVTKLPTPAPASAEARATKVDRLRYLESWAMENPLATIEAARDTVRQKYGISLGTKIISDTLRNAKALWEAQRRDAVERNVPMAPPSAPRLVEAPAPVESIGQHIARIASELKASGIRLVEVLPDGNVRVELVGLSTLTQGPS
jgi:hypothetical protein